MAIEYLAEHGYAPPGSRAFTIGQYVTSDPDAGIRNYNMSDSPLNYSHIDYDFVGLQVHASGEVWSATNFDISAGDDRTLRCRHRRVAEVLRQR